MPEFRRYRDSNGAEFTQAVSPELAHEKGWTDITSVDNPAIDTDGKPVRTKPAERRPAAKASPAAPAPKSTTATGQPANDIKGA